MRVPGHYSSAEEARHRDRFNEMVSAARSEAAARAAAGEVRAPEDRYRFMDDNATAEAGAYTRSHFRST